MCSAHTHTHTYTHRQTQVRNHIKQQNTTIHTNFQILAKPCKTKYGFLKFRKHDDAIKTCIITTNSNSDVRTRQVDASRRAQTCSIQVGARRVDASRQLIYKSFVVVSIRFCLMLSTSGIHTFSCRAPLGFPKTCA